MRRTILNLSLHPSRTEHVMEKLDQTGELLFIFNAGAQAPTESPEVRLVRAAQAGDRDAFGRLYESYGRMVHGILLARVPHGEVDDLVQEVFLGAFRRLDALRDPRTFGGWLATIARNRAHDYHRRAREADELSEQMPAPDAPCAEAAEALRLLQSLPDTYRETLVMRLVEGMSGADIAARTGLTPASVRVNLHRGMRRLRKMMLESEK